MEYRFFIFKTTENEFGSYLLDRRLNPCEKIVFSISPRLCERYSFPPCRVKDRLLHAENETGDDFFRNCENVILKSILKQGGLR